MALSLSFTFIVSFIHSHRRFKIPSSHSKSKSLFVSFKSSQNIYGALSLSLSLIVLSKSVWYMCLNTYFQFSNNITYIFTLFHLHIFLKNTNNVIRTILPNGPEISTFHIFVSFSFGCYP